MLRGHTVLLLSFAICLVSAVNNKVMSNECLCDVSDQCDYECCCDAECSYTLTKKLSELKKCDDDGFGIPYCQNFNETDLHTRDLYSGLSTIYTVLLK